MATHSGDRNEPPLAELPAGETAGRSEVETGLPEVETGLPEVETGEPMGGWSEEPISLLLALMQEVNRGASRERVFALVADALREIFAIDRFALVLMHQEGLRLALSVGLSPEYVAAANRQMNISAGARALAQRRPLYIPDAPEEDDFWPLQEAARAEGFHSVLILPLFADPGPLGYLIMYHDVVRPYTTAEVILAQALAQQAAVALQHAQLRAEIEARRSELEQAFQRRVDEAALLDDILLRISSSLDLESTLQSIVDAAASLVRAESASLYLRDVDGAYRATASHGLPLAELRRVVLTADQGLIGRLCDTGKPAQVTNFIEQVSTISEARELVAGLGVQATLGVPLMQGDDCVGALYVARREETSFPPDEVRTLERLASFAIVAVQNARRFTDVEAERRRLQEYVDAFPEAVIVYDRAGKVLLINDAMAQEIGMRQSLAGHVRGEILAHPERFQERPMTFRHDPEEVFQRVLRSAKSEQVLLDMHDPDQTYEMHVSPIKGTGNRVEGIVATMRDISAPLELERERSRANLLAQLLDLSALLNSDLSVPLLLEHVVEAAMSLVGARAGTLGLIEGDKLVFRRFYQPQGWIDFDISLSPGEGAPGYVWQTRRPYIANASETDPHVLAEAQQLLGFHRLVCVPVVNRAGTMIGTLGVYDPIVERDFGRRDVESLQLLAHQVAIAIENARLNEMKDSFLSVVSHELKTPVTSIKGFTQMLQRRLSPESLERAGRYLATINHQTDRLTSLINDLLDLSRIQTGRFHFALETIDFTRLVRDVVEEMQLLAPENRIDLSAPDAVTGRGNADRLRQVLVNLIDNAVQHGPPGGVIQVTVTAGDGAVTTCVSDQGPGLPEDEARRIFEPYYQVQQGAVPPAKGLGLGLYISRQVVEQHHGRIWVESAQPTTFCFSVPVEVSGIRDQVSESDT
jgi:PAS domain S-box-containing protein